MTQLRKHRDAISNYFDQIERGIGKRGSTFTDVDAVSHDGDTRRFLFREFKQDGERLDPAQRWVLRELAHLPGCTVWFVRKRDDGRIGWAVFGSGRPRSGDYGSRLPAAPAGLVGQPAVRGTRAERARAGRVGDRLVRRRR